MFRSPRSPRISRGHNESPVINMRQHALPSTGFLRLTQIVGNKKADPPIPPLYPVSKSTWWAGVKSGRYPQPVKLSERCTAWRVEDVLTLINQRVGGESL